MRAGSGYGVKYLLLYSIYQSHAEPEIFYSLALFNELFSFLGPSNFFPGSKT
jgi:hypothetical protein